MPPYHSYLPKSRPKVVYDQVATMRKLVSGVQGFVAVSCVYQSRFKISEPYLEVFCVLRNSAEFQGHNWQVSCVSLPCCLDSQNTI